MKGSEWIYFFAINLQIYCCDTTAQMFKGHMLREKFLVVTETRPCVPKLQNYFVGS